MGYSTIVILIGLVAAGEGAPADLAALLPETVDGWKAAPPDEHADFDTLFKLIDGAAEVYRSLNVRRVVSRRYVNPATADIIAEVYDMGSSEDAYAAFHFDVRDGPGAKIGRESEFEKPNLFFWKDRYFASVASMAPGAAAEAAVLSIGKAVSSAIPRDGEPPELVRGLPKDGLVESQIHYFHDWPLLKRHYAPVDENLLGLDKGTSGVAARYRVSEGKGKPTAGALTTVILIRYPSSEAAQKALAAYRSKVIPKADARGLQKDAGGRFTGARAAGDRLAIVIDAPDEKTALERLNNIERAPARKERP